jgi:hypothetical protein
MASPQGLHLHRVYYPREVDNPGALLYPGEPHDEHGRLLCRLPAAAKWRTGGGTSGFSDGEASMARVSCQVAGVLTDAE